MFSKISRTFLRPGRYLCGPLSIFVKGDFPYDTLEDPREVIPKTGWERLYKAFSDREPGWPSKESISLMQLVGASFFVGFLVGGMKKGNEAYGNFIVANQHTKFITPYEAKRKLQDTVVLYFFKGGTFWGTKVALFTGIYSFCVIAIPIYRNTEQGILEYFIGGALAGGLSRFHLGVKAALVSAGLVGIVTGFVGFLMFLSSTSMSEIRDMQYTWYEWRRKRIEEFLSSTKKDHHSPIFSKIVGMRDQRLKKEDTLGYSKGETVYIAVTDPNEVSEPTKPEAEDEKSNEQLHTDVTAVRETTSTNK